MKYIHICEQGKPEHKQDKQREGREKQTKTDQISDAKDLVPIFKRSERWKCKLVQLLWKTIWQC